VKRSSFAPHEFEKKTRSMKIRIIIYWVTTVLIALETLAGGVMDLAHGRTSVVSGPFVVDVITHLGYPVYLLTILGVWKLAGGVTLLVPGFPRLKEWAYAGIFFELTGAAASFVARGEITGDLIAPLVLTSLAVASWALRPQSRTLSVLFPAKKPA